MKFNKLSINDNLQKFDSYEFLEPDPEVVGYILPAFFKKRYQNIINRLVPVFLYYYQNVSSSPSKFFVCIERTSEYLLDNEPRYYIIKLPIFPKNVEKMVIVGYWLEQLSDCVFEYASFDGVVFNPELINLLFDNDKLLFHIQKPKISSNDDSFGNVWNFVSNHLTISEYLSINLNDINVQRLHGILVSGGNNLPKIRVRNVKTARLYNTIVKHISTAKDCSKMLANITLCYSSPTRFELNERAEEVEITEQLNGVKYTKYQLENIHNPNVRFSFSNEEGKDGKIVCVKIRKMEA
uniref:Uncharacterized protein n=1 Tax=Meloidogyne enterolobii TaxID=390850 RepID=A0A6V7UDS1_MELEN|nr:unnamed protein product [Meloidogyne enterolobii]